MVSFLPQDAEVSEPAQADASAALARPNDIDLEVKIAHAAAKAIDEARGQLAVLGCRTQHNADPRLEPERERLHQTGQCLAMRPARRTEACDQKLVRPLFH
jgi:hypothetical protein